ncbi:TIGR04222 domain-containing membrane protein [Pseudonocardia sp. T1-2H]|uniref:TIGR04222 domain-containing membrane protein n=1 Tax=Pseudonocardia sp. T1-2H TaxID=3128899 RepID=UPI003100BD90
MEVFTAGDALAAQGDTWGISGSTFLEFYVVLAAAVWIVSSRARRRLAAGGPDLVTGLESRPHDVAYLNGGPDLAVYSALSAMKLSGTIRSSGKGQVQSSVRSPVTDDLERAVAFTASAPTPRHRLRYHGVVSTALGRIEDRLVREGLLLSEEQRSAIRRTGLWMLAVAVLGLFRLLAGLANARPVGFLVIVLLGVGVVTVVELVRAPQRSRAGDRALAELRTRHHGLSPTMKPDWVAYGAGAAALGVGLYGTGALWASDPAFADELAVQKAAAGSGWSGDGGSSWSSGGDSGGSSGGGGCGGGGGGCGG